MIKVIVLMMIKMISQYRCFCAVTINIYIIMVIIISPVSKVMEYDDNQSL